MATASQKIMLERKKINCHYVQMWANKPELQVRNHKNKRLIWQKRHEPKIYVYFRDVCL